MAQSMFSVCDIEALQICSSKMIMKCLKKVKIFE